MIAAAMLMQQAQMPKMNPSPSSNTGAPDHSKNAFEQLLNERQLLSSESNTSHPNEHDLRGDRDQKESSKEEMLLEKLQTAFHQMPQIEKDDAALDLDKIRDFVAALKKQFLALENNGEEIELSAKTKELDQLAALLTKDNPSVQVSQVIEPREILKPLTANINNVNEYLGMVGNEVQQSATRSEKDILANLTEVVKWLEQASVAVSSSNMQPNTVEKQTAVPQLSEKTAELIQRMVSTTSNAESKSPSLIKRDWRDRMPTSQTDTKLTSAAMAALLEQELGAKAKPEIGTVMQIQNDPPAGTWMPKLEQYVIHLNYTQGNASPDQQLMEQFQKVIQSSKFLNTPAGGANQLSITLNPSNLGEMNLRFAEVNGEMTVKIMVTTQVAKDMLETNMKQLRNMFSPHQVVVEKQDMAVSQSENIDDTQQQQEEQDEREEYYFHQQEEQDNQQNELDFESQLKEVLLNEKV